MKQIYDQMDIIAKFLPKQEIVENQKYRKFFCVVECPVEEGVLFFNTITYEFIFLSNEEYSLLSNPDLKNSTIQYLIKQYFLVPNDFDDKKFASQVIDTRLMIQNVYHKDPIYSLTILPTTACNARCFYCYEAGAPVSNMTEETAHAVADYIKINGAKQVRISWFGGEPLINQKAIDIISQDLKDNNVNFVSSIITNGYLFDEETVNKAVKLWNLKKVQITLDGTEEVYNKVKDYVYKDVSSPFIRVLNNIEAALKAGLELNIRLNMDMHNRQDLFELSKIIVKRYSKYENCSVYVKLLYDDYCTGDYVKSSQDRHQLTVEAGRLQSYLSCNMHKKPFNKGNIELVNTNGCMACVDSSVMIVPDGHLGKCEHYIDRDFYGSVFSDEVNLETIIRYKERASIGPQCDECEFRSLCLRPKCCTGVSRYCDEIDKELYKKRLVNSMAGIYKRFAAEEE